jgi:hypothetical protein
MPEIGDSKMPDSVYFEHKPRDCYTQDGHRKKTYPTKKAAKIGMRLRAKGKGDTDHLHVYRCKTCKQYHVGHRA